MPPPSSGAQPPSQNHFARNTCSLLPCGRPHSNTWPSEEAKAQPENNKWTRKILAVCGQTVARLPVRHQHSLENGCAGCRRREYQFNVERTRAVGFPAYKGDCRCWSPVKIVFVAQLKPTMPAPASVLHAIGGVGVRHVEITRTRSTV